MAVVLGGLYDALKGGGTAEEKARKTAEEVAGFEYRFVGLNRIWC